MAVVAWRAVRLAVLAGIMLIGAGSAFAQQKVGISSAVNPQATGTPPGAAAHPLVIGQEVVFNERIATTDKGQTQLLFLDESSMSVGPNSDLTIDQFVYDPSRGTGKLAMSATRGLLRYVGGKLSKQDGAVTLRTSTATLAVRGGAFILNIQHDGVTQVIFLYGDGITLRDAQGVVRSVTRPGFEITISRNGQSTPPQPTPPQQLAQFTTLLDGQNGGTGGAPVIPTNASVAQVSAPLTQTLQATLQNVIANFPNVRTPSNEQTNINPQPNPAPQIIVCTALNSCVDTVQVGTTTNGQPVGGPNSIHGTQPPASQTVSFSGRVKNTNGGGTSRGFVDQSANGDIPYSNGTLTFTQGTPQSGVFTGTFGNLGTITFPLQPGTVTFGPTGTASSFGTFSGTSFLSPDDTFFYASITPTSQPGQRLFVYGGTPVNSSFYATTGPGARPSTLPNSTVTANTRVFAFTVQPDAALQSAIPFIRSQTGGNIPGASVSPFYVVAPPTTAIGDTSTNAAARGLQASLAINGRGANQQSAIAVTAGTIGTLQSSGQPVFTGQLRGSSLVSANGTPVTLASAVSSTVDGSGNSFYGGNSITGFALDQTRYAAGANGSVGSAVIPSTASETAVSGAQTTYGFAQPATPTGLPSGVGVNRTTQALTGSFGGLMYTNAQSTPYALTGSALISTDAPNNRVQATLSGTPQSNAAGASAVTMQYGGLTGNSGGQAFVDNNTFAATESTTNPQQITINGTSSQPTGQLYLASSGAAGLPTQLLPQGASFCQCQYLQWGYWGGSLTTANGAGTPRTDAGNINFWVAGVPTGATQATANDLHTLATQNFAGTYNGAAIGSVFNNGASYAAAGGFQGTYNFGTQTGTFAVSNFDGHNFVAGGRAPLTGANYTFAGTANGFAGKVNGTFYGPMAAETGGNFAFQSVAGPTYIASGIFAGKR